MEHPNSIGIKKIDALHFYVHDLDRIRAFYTGMLDFEEVGESTPEVNRRFHQRSVLFRAGDVRILCSQPMGEGGKAWRYLRKHPAGVGGLIFEVEEIERTFEILETRGGTPTSNIVRMKDNTCELSTFSITTPFGDTDFRFVQRVGGRGFFPGFAEHPVARGGRNRYEFSEIDHVTSNFRTLQPAMLWMEHVLGLEPYWKIEFHTDDVAPDADKGSGLRSQVMWDPGSGVKFANNEPYRPHFRASQISIFNEEQRGDGVQHAALVVRDIVSAVRAFRARGLSFMPTPGPYYDALPGRLERLGVGQIEEDIGILRELEILVDGAHESAYLLQIFLKESAALFQNPEAGPFFYEIIQRKGDQGFGAGNFRALFESIETQHKREGRV